MELIDKEKVVAELERIKKEECPTDSYEGRCKLFWFEQFSSFLDTLEVEEVDLDNNIRTYLTNHFNIYEDGVLQSKKSGLPLKTYDIIKVAEHFFELGIKAKKGGMTMDYEKAYKEALERAKKIHNQTEFDYEKGMMEEIFPELGESEEEIGIKEPISKTFPRVNEFEMGASYRR